MLVLAIDTSTPAVTAGVVRLSRQSADTLATRVTHNARAHAEVLTPQVLEALAECDHGLGDLDAVVVGVGPGPYTGLRVGMATAAAFADALGIPVHGVCSLDAIAVEAHAQAPAEADATGNLLVVTDARRREVYWARYEGGRRVSGPAVLAPAELPASPSVAVAGSAEHTALFDLPAIAVHSPTPAGLVSVAAEPLLAGAVPEPLVPLYLRRPDAVEPKPRAVRAAQSSAVQAGAGSGS